MSVSRCLDLEIGRLPPDQWGAAIAQLPEVCQHPGDCTVRVGCRAYVADYYRAQWRIRKAREKRMGGNAHAAG